MRCDAVLAFGVKRGRFSLKYPLLGCALDQYAYMTNIFFILPASSFVMFNREICE